MPIEARVDESGGGVDEQSEPAEARFPLHAADEIVGHRDPLKGGAKDELAGVEHERLRAVLGHLDELGEAGLVGFDVDDGGGVIAEHPEEMGDPNVDRGGLDELVVVGVDHDPTGGDLLANRAVRQDHAGHPSAARPGDEQSPDR